MGEARQPLNPTTQSVGMTAKLVTVQSVSGDGRTAVVTDRQGVQAQVPMLVQRSKGPLPAPGETWLLAQDLGAWYFAAFVGGSPAAFAAGGGGTRVTVAARPPSSPSAGDVWLNSAQGNALSWWTGSAWSQAPLGAAALADASVTGSKVAAGTLTSAQLSAAAGITAGQVAFTAGDIGGSVIYTGTSQPPQARPGEMWINPANGNALSIWNGGDWVAAQFGAPAIAAGSLTGAQLAVNAGIAPGQVDFTASDIGGVTTSVGFQQPSSPATGDLWFNGNQGFSLQQWNGTAWVPYKYGTQAIAAGSVTAALIAANTITATQIAAGTITAAQIAANTILGANIAAGTLTTVNLGAGAVEAVNVAANQFGLNMIADPQFSNASLNAIRAAPPATGTWTVGTGTAAVGVGTHSQSLYLTPLSALWLAPGEQYYASVTVTVTGACTVGIGFQDSGLTTAVSLQHVFSGAGTFTLSGVLTVPSGPAWTTGNIRLYVLGQGSGTPTATFSAPSCQVAQLFLPTIKGTNYEVNPAGTFGYAGTPAAGNLVYSEAPAGGTDRFGNTFIIGNTWYAYGGTPVLAFSVTPLGFIISAAASTSSSYALQSVLGPGINNPHTGDFEFQTVSGTDLKLRGDVNMIEAISQLVVDQPIAAAAPGGSFGAVTAEAWHKPGSLSGGWAQGSPAFQYRLTAEGKLGVAGLIDSAAMTATTFFTLPPAYQPATIGADFPVSFHTGTGYTQGAFGRLTNAGALQIVNATTGTGVVVLDAEIPLDLT